MKGIIALDIDGTLTGPDHQITQEVLEYLDFLHSQEWQFIFISGRPFSWAESSLREILFPYFLAIYNGAYLLSMPEKQIAERFLIDRDVLEKMNAVCDRFSTGCVVYGGPDHGEKIYFTPMKFDEKTRDFFEKRSQVTNENWIPVESLSEIPFDKFAAVKCFVPLEQSEELAAVIEDELELYVPRINDPVDSAYVVLQATNPHANKGDTLEIFSTICRWSGVRIAAGNDMNDFPMFQKAQITIAMQDAPLMLRQLATVVAPSAEDLGLITGLKSAIAKYETGRRS